MGPNAGRRLVTNLLLLVLLGGLLYWGVGLGHRRGAAGDDAGSAAAGTRVPNAWRASSRTEQRWISEPLQSVRGRAWIWNLIPGLGLLRVRKWLAAALFLAGFAVLARWIVSLRDMPPLATGLYVGIVSAAAHIQTTEQVGRAAPAFFERLSAWVWRRQCRRPDCPRCGVRPARRDAGFCGECHQALAPYAHQWLTPAVRAADGFSYRTDDTVHPHIVGDLRIHGAMGTTRTRSVTTLREGAELDARALDDRRDLVLAAYSEPLDATVVWLLVRCTARLGDGTPMVIDEVRRAAYEGESLTELWETIVRISFPGGGPSDRAGRERVQVPAKVRRQMAV